MIMQRLAIAAAAALLISAVPTRSVAPAGNAVPDIAPLAPGEIGLLTYNVQDLPWPIVGDRSEDLAAIGARLAELRERGAAPQIVVLQEAFSEQSRAMLRNAGYEHIAVGPSAAVARPAPPAPLDPGFLDNRRFLSGEAQAALLSSGLIIASDFPILSVVSAPFPRDVCAGIDCLANKGVMLARIALPGVTKPVEIVTTHLNAGRKSRTPPAHHLYAWRHQLDAVGRFIGEHGDPRATRLFAGDVNVSHSADRLKLLQSRIAGWGMAAVTAMGKPHYAARCGGVDGPCKGTLPIAANVPLVHTLDWQLTRATSGTTVDAVARHVLFGQEGDGTMLSDHIGYAVRYRIAG